jgi:two-component system, LytTR family, response regulator
MSGSPEVRRLSTIIVDGDPGSRDNLRELCKSRTELEVIAECSGSEEARDVILSRRPDLAFLAVKLHATTGFQLVRELPESTAPLVVFVSTHDQYALQAFELGAVDYILKPIAQTRFCETVQRVVSRARASELRVRRDREETAREDSSVNVTRRAPRLNGVHRFILEIGDRVHLVEIADIESIEADRNYVWINTGDTYKVRASLKELEALLPSESFFRVNRGVIVNARCIKSIERRAHGAYAIHLGGGGVVTTGRRFKGHIPGVILRRQT